MPAAAACRRAEALFHAGRRDEALRDARLAFARDPYGEATADFCAWLFSNCGVHAEAAAAYRRLLAHRPGWAEGHRHLSGSLAMIGAAEEAAEQAAHASDLSPECYEFALHAGSLLADAGRRQARRYLERAAALAPDRSEPLQRLAALVAASGDNGEAAALALRALRLAPDDRTAALQAAELLLRAGRLDDGAAVARHAAAATADGAAWRLLSAAEMLCGRLDAALAAIDRALADQPHRAEYHEHRGTLLRRLGRFHEAAAAFAEAARLDPANPRPRRAQLGALYEGGRLVEALAVGGGLLQSAPDNADYAEAVVAVVNRRRDLLDGIAALPPADPRPRAPRPPPRFAAALRTQARVIHALIIRETRTRFADSLLGYGWALLEPVAHILMLSLVFQVIMHGRPPLGSDFFIFYYTGIIPYHVFVHSSSSMTHAITSNLSLLQLPRVTTFDVVLARGLLEFATDLVVAAVLLTGFAAAGRPAMPHHVIGIAAATLAVWLFACGCGLINAVLNAFVKSWDKIWTQVVRFLYFISGIFYVPANMPDWVRDMLAWNPVLQAVDWFRSGFFVAYEPHWLDRAYLAELAVLALLAGFALERALRRRLFEPQ